MNPTDPPPKRHVTIRKGATQSGMVAEFLMLLETVTADGRIDDREAQTLQAWLAENENSGLPAVEFLRSTLGQILADGVITSEERKALHIAVERVLPPELRQEAKSRRTVNELLEKAKSQAARVEAREAKAAEAAVRKANQPAFSANYMVAGVLYDGRAALVDQYLQPGQEVTLWRDPGNPHDANAIEVWIPQGKIGFVPREDASQMARLLDAGYEPRSQCTKILEGSRAPIPVVQSDLRRASDMAEADDPLRREVRGYAESKSIPMSTYKVPSTPASSGRGCVAFGCLAMFAFGALLWFISRIS